MTGVLTALMTHQPAAAVQAQLAALDAFAPHQRVAVVYGGPGDQVPALPAERTVFVPDPSLRGPLHDQQYTDLFLRVFERFVRDDPSVTHLYLAEYDHMLLRLDYDTALLDVATRTGADFLGHNAIERSGTNWPHYIRYRDDPAFLAFLHSISVRDDPTRIYGCLGDGMFMTREALAAFAAIEHHPCYVEVYIPTVMHHLGHRVADMTRESDLYRWVRANPPFDESELRTALAEGAAFIHPFKDPLRGIELAAGATGRAA